MLVLLALVLSALVLSACSGASRHEVRASGVAASSVVATGAAHLPDAPSTVPAGPYLNDGDHDVVSDADGDNSRDDDNDASLDYKPEERSSRYHDADDGGLLTYGHAANPAQERAVASVVERYYAIAAAEDGAGACAQLPRSLAAAVPLDYGRYGPSYLRPGKTCAAVLALLFKHDHRQLAAGVAVTGVRISGDQAYALLGSRAMSASDIVLQSEGGAWRLTQLLGNENVIG